MASSTFGAQFHARATLPAPRSRRTRCCNGALENNQGYLQRHDAEFEELRAREAPIKDQEKLLTDINLQAVELDELEVEKDRKIKDAWRQY